MMRMRQQIDARRNRASKATNTSGNWFRVGVLSATVAAPLIARWNDLRTSNRAQTLREIAAARLSDARDAREQASIRLAPVRAAANTRLADARDYASARLDEARELASARLDDVRVAAQPRIDDALDRLAQVRAPERLRSVPPFSLAIRRSEELARRRQRRRRQTMLLWMAGVGVGLIAAGVTAYVVARRRMTTAIEDEEPMVELPTERNLAEAIVGSSAAMRNSYAMPTERAEMSVPVQTFTTTGTTSEASHAPYVGNIHTMIFHDANDVAHLPAEENRIYFSSESEARKAGYRLAREPEESGNQ